MLLKERDLSSFPLEKCTLCGKCQSVCPVVDKMEYGPMGIVRLVFLGEEEKAATLKDLWFCTKCRMCSEVCPVGIDVFELLDILREKSIISGKQGDSSWYLLGKKIYEIVKKYGRIPPVEVEHIFLRKRFVKEERRGFLGMFRKREEYPPLEVKEDYPNFWKTLEEYTKKVKGGEKK